MAAQTNATRASGGFPPSAPESIAIRLRNLEPLLGQLGREDLHAALAPVIEALGADPAPPAPREDVEGALGFCRRLFAAARSPDALALAHAAHDLACRTGDAALRFRTSAACGIVHGDAGDFVTAIEYHLEALRVATAGDIHREMSRAWCNIGVAFSAAGNYTLAAPSFHRALELCDPGEGIAPHRFFAASNLASAYFHLGRFEDGLRFARRALADVTPEARRQDPQAEILLHRNFVNLLVATGHASDAESHALEAARLAQALDTPRAAIAAAVARATWEVATGRHEFALTRLQRAMETARGIPAGFRETLVCAIRAEEAAGNPERALLRLQELADHIYRSAIDRVKERMKLLRLQEAAGQATGPFTEHDRVRLAARVERPCTPAQWTTLERLARGAALRFDPTGRHGERVGALTQAAALACGIDPLLSLEIGLASRLHDIGMASVPEAIAGGAGPRNALERELYMRHTEAGAEMLGDAHAARLLLAREIARYHHAHWDGTGHPFQVGGRAIPRPARLCAVADAYDSLVCGEGSRPPCSMDEALAELARGAGTRFDPEIVPRFEALIREEAEEIGLDTRATVGADAFGQLVNSLQEDRGFL
jgi:putative two-component system response regulator